LPNRATLSPYSTNENQINIVGKRIVAHFDSQRTPVLQKINYFWHLMCSKHFTDLHYTSNKQKL